MKIKKTGFLLLLSLPLIVHAGGFQINTQSIKGTAMGGAYSGVCKDASGVFFNPGSMAFMDKNSIIFGAALIMPSSSYLNPYGSNVDMKNQIFYPPQLYANYKINEKISVGLSINTPYGLGTKWDDDWTGRYVSQEVTLKTFYFQPTVSYLITDKIGVGAGFVFTSGNADVRKAQQAGNNDIQAELKGNGTGFGYNVGVFARIGEKARVGIDYHSKVQVDLNNGDATFSNVPSSLIAAGEVPESTTFNSGLALPSSLTIGASYQITTKLMATIEFDYTGWDVFDSLNFDFPDYPSLNSHNGRNYKNSTTIRAGVEYQLKPKIAVRIGGALDQSPVQDDYVSPELPDADKQALTVGASYKLNEKFSFDVSYAYENLSERKGNYVQENFNGLYKTRVHIVGIGINYSW
ncbi:MAG: OmpP1/FadL family transporter [Bacteroidia bacterium]